MDALDTAPPTSKPQRPPSRFRTLVSLIILALVGWGIYTALPKLKRTPPGAPGSAGAGRRGPAITPVVAARAVKGDIGVYEVGLGAVLPINTVTVRSRVDGQLMKVHYTEDQIVHEGDLLLEIDPRPFQVQLIQAEGQLLRDQASLENARLDLTRYEKLWSENAIPQQQLTTQRAAVAQYEGAVKTDQGQVESAKLNMTYCRILAPLTGRVGLRLVDPGNMVHANDSNGLVVITQLDPISILFNIAEKKLDPIVKRKRAGQRLLVEAWDSTKQKIAEGTLATIDNQIDQTTGTVKLRAIFSNSREKLFPGQFVDAHVLVEEKRGVTLVPNNAVQRNSVAAAFAFVVKEDQTVTIRNLVTGVTEGDQTEVVEGLAPGDVVVTEGVDKLAESSRVVARISGEKRPQR